MKIRLLFVLLAMPLWAAAQDSIPLRVFEPLREEAAGHEAAGNFEAALAAIGQVHPSDSSFCQVRVLKSYYLLNLSRYEDAIAEADLGLADDCPEQDASLYINKGVSFLQLERFREALAVFEKGIAEFPMHANLWYNKALSLEKMGELEAAVRTYENALLRNPYLQNAWVRMGDIFYKQGRMSQALMCFDVFQLMDPDGDNALRLLKLINDAVAADNTNTPDRSLGPDDSGFDQMDLILTQRVALSPSYSTGNPLDFSLVRQNHALMQQLGGYKGGGGFWQRKVVPTFRWIWESGQFDPFVYALCYATTNEAYEKLIEKQTDRASEFLQAFRAQLAQNMRMETEQVQGTPVEVAYYFNDSHIVGVGQMAGENGKGFWQFYDENGRPSGTGNFDAQGERDGTWEWMYPDGTLKEKAEYAQGELHGPNHSYFKNGRPYISTSYQKGALHGDYQLFNENGARIQQKTFDNGELQGMYTSYFRSGASQPEFLIPYEKGEVHGAAVEYYSDGKPYSEMQYSQGIQSGEERNYYPTGVLSSRVQYQAGMRHGPYEAYYFGGQLKEQGQSREGQGEGLWKTWYPDGTLESEYTMSGGSADGTYTYYDRDGKLHYTYQYRKGEIIAYAFYDKEGKLISEGSKKGGEFLYAGRTPLGHPWSEGLYDIKGGRMGLWKYYNNFGLLQETGRYENNLAQGTITTVFPDGSPSIVANYVNDSLHGYYREYHKNGVVKVQGWHQDGMKQGEWWAYYPDGTPERSEFFHNNELLGDQTLYTGNGEPYVVNHYEIGQLVREVNFRQPGMPADTMDLRAHPGQFTQVLYHVNGQVKAEYSYMNGVLDGPYKRLDSEGRLEAEGAFLNGQEHGTWKRYYESGQVKNEIGYYLGRLHGPFLQYHENGTLDSRAEFILEERASDRGSYFDNGNLDVQTAYKDGMEHGPKSFYDTEGHLQLIRYYEYGRLIGYSYPGPDGKEVPMIPLPDATGLIRAYYDNGKPSREMEVFHGFFNNTYKEYHYNGQLAQEFSYLYGDYHGTNTEYYPDGTLKKVEHFLLDELHGEVTEYFANGQVRQVTTYTNGRKNGPRRTFDEQGNRIGEATYFNDAVIAENK